MANFRGAKAVVVGLGTDESVAHSSALLKAIHALAGETAPAFPHITGLEVFSVSGREGAQPIALMCDGPNSVKQIVGLTESINGEVRPEAVFFQGGIVVPCDDSGDHVADADVGGVVGVAGTIGPFAFRLMDAKMKKELLGVGETLHGRWHSATASPRIIESRTVIPMAPSESGETAFMMVLHMSDEIWPEGQRHPSAQAFDRLRLAGFHPIRRCSPASRAGIKSTRDVVFSKRKRQNDERRKRLVQLKLDAMMMPTQPLHSFDPARGTLSAAARAVPSWTSEDPVFVVDDADWEDSGAAAGGLAATDGSWGDGAASIDGAMPSASAAAGANFEEADGETPTPNLDDEIDDDCILGETLSAPMLGASADAGAGWGEAGDYDGDNDGSLDDW
jgi:hypothetical protein